MNISYCLECAAPLTKTTDTAYQCPNDHFYYNNPQPAVAVIFLKGTQALFSKRGREPDKGKYDLPGGFIEYGEDAYKTCVREIQEETGVYIDRSDLRLVSVYTDDYLPNVTVIDLVFVATKWRGEFTPADDSEALEWKSLDFIESPDFAPRYGDLINRLKPYIANHPSQALQ